MRVYLEGDATAGEFSSLLLDVGNGRLLVDKDGMITVPSGFAQVVESVEVLYNKVYPNRQSTTRTTSGYVSEPY